MIRTVHGCALGGGAMFISRLAAAQERSVDAAVTTSVWSELIAILLPLGLIVVALLGVLIWARRRAGLSAGAGPLSIEQVLGVGTRERIVLLRAGSRRLIVGVTGSGISRLGELNDGDET